MWSELFLMNKDYLLENMERFSIEFARLKALLEANDREGIREMMRISTKRRKLFDKPKAQ
jgi:prephenate dehydrogenase